MCSSRIRIASIISGSNSNIISIRGIIPSIIMLVAVVLLVTPSTTRG